jgi:bifunctional non-homologous end joining protein LigD
VSTAQRATRPRAPKRSAAKTAGETLLDGPRKVSLTHPERVLFPEDGLTKGDLVHYYRDVAPFLLPYLKDRPLTLERYPQGIGAPSFFEKNVPLGAPAWLETVAMPSTGRRKTVNYPLCNDEASLLWAANMGAITLHVWMSRVGTITHPDYILFDLDPFEGCTVKTLARVALHVRGELEAIGLPPLVKTTGGKGLHLLVPLEPVYAYDEVRGFGEILARRAHEALPDLVTLDRSKAKRSEGTVYMDWVQLGQGKTLVPPFVVRAREGAPVSMPLEWREVEAMESSRGKDTTRELRRWNITNVPRLLAENGDPWARTYAKKRRLEPALGKARAAWGEAGEAGEAGGAGGASDASEDIEEEDRD